MVPAFIYLWFAFPAAWDSTAGFPGEGPPSYHRTPAQWELPQLVGVENQFIQHSRSVLTGASPGSCTSVPLNHPLYEYRLHLLTSNEEFNL